MLIFIHVENDCDYVAFIEFYLGLETPSIGRLVYLL